MKFRSYVLGDKVWLNSKYITTKQNCKLKAKLFGLLKVLYLVGKQVYKLELPKKWRIYDVFHMSLLEQVITKKRWVNKTMYQIELNKSNSKENKVKAICNNKIYAKELNSSYHLLGLYFLISWKNYPQEKNT